MNQIITVIKNKLYHVKALAFLVIALTTSNTAIAIQYTITDLGTIGGNGSFSAAYGINDLGDVVGYSYASSTMSAFLYSNGHMQDIGAHGVATDINNHQQIVGTLTDPNFPEQAFIYRNGVATSVGTGNFSSGLNAINNKGEAVGRIDYGKASHYSNGSMSQIGNLGGNYSSAQDINDYGQIAGSSDRSDNGTQHAFFYDGIKTIDLGTLGGDYSWATGLNNLGKVVGGAYLTNGPYHAYLYDAGVMVDIGSLGGYSSANAINDAGYVVGNSTTSNFNDYRAFLYHAGTLSDLNTFAGVAGSGWVLRDAVDINSSGQIVGTGYNPQGQSRAFLLTPVPEPETYAMLLAGLGLLAFRVRSYQAWLLNNKEKLSLEIPTEF